MWRRLKNIFLSFSTYTDLSPDVQAKQRINQFLRRRPALSAQQWFELFWQPLGVSRQVTDFVYTHMQAYSGLEFARVKPSDRLNEDLHLPLVCWFDWEVSLYEDFLSNFGIDLSQHFDPNQLSTVEDFVVFLNHQLLSVNHS